MLQLRRLFQLSLFLLPACVFCQRPYDIPVTAEFKNTPLPSILADLEKQCELRIFYPPDRIPVYKMSVSFEEEPLKNVLQTVLFGSGMRVTNLGENRIIIAPMGEMNRKYIDDLVAGWESGKLQSPLLQELLEEQRTLGKDAPVANENTPVILRGIVTDGSTDEPIIGATLIVRESGVGTATDEQGKFQLKIRSGNSSILVEYVGYQSVLIKVNALGSDKISIQLNPDPFQLSEVLIEAEAIQGGAKSSSTGLEKLTVQSLKELPVLLGEADVLKSLLYLPGISTVGEGSGGFNVRGGNVDQNLILQEGV
ncbi:MAG: carboxypeptidase-like regulatory domain-containing protein, partial [Bacteroidota bacterium]